MNELGIPYGEATSPRGMCRRYLSPGNACPSARRMEDNIGAIAPMELCHLQQTPSTSSTPAPYYLCEQHEEQSDTTPQPELPTRKKKAAKSANPPELKSPEPVLPAPLNVEEIRTNAVHTTYHNILLARWYRDHQVPACPLDIPLAPHGASVTVFVTYGLWPFCFFNKQKLVCVSCAGPPGLLGGPTWERGCTPLLQQSRERLHAQGLTTPSDLSEDDDEEQRVHQTCTSEKDLFDLIVEFSSSMVAVINPSSYNASLSQYRQAAAKEQTSIAPDKVQDGTPGSFSTSATTTCAVLRENPPVNATTSLRIVVGARQDRMVYEEEGGHLAMYLTSRLIPSPHGDPESLFVIYGFGRLFFNKPLRFVRRRTLRRQKPKARASSVRDPASDANFENVLSRSGASGIPKPTLKHSGQQNGSAKPSPFDLIMPPKEPEYKYRLPLVGTLLHGAFEPAIFTYGSAVSLFKSKNLRCCALVVGVIQVQITTTTMVMPTVITLRGQNKPTSLHAIPSKPAFQPLSKMMKTRNRLQCSNKWKNMQLQLAKKKDSSEDSPSSVRDNKPSVRTLQAYNDFDKKMQMGDKRILAAANINHTPANQVEHEPGMVRDDPIRHVFLK
ncbi:hypothetical protein EJ08DRAFT_725199 [Tothia fuscella]|uniref:Uncharacterized protein n=1 Tax=Tothia fuscella TaxID=1048955 RepID=A0A9P4NJ27_9PEZI|nr:hypothetical protein EJ08DRAFT_725199 [Tothia fuscella]